MNPLTTSSTSYPLWMLTSYTVITAVLAAGALTWDPAMILRQDE